MKEIKSKPNHGFTLVETMIATAIFTVIMLIGISTILAVNRSHKTTENTRQVIDSLSFVMEDMARNIRLGSIFYCPTNPPFDSTKPEQRVSCPPTKGTFMASSILALEGLSGVPDSTLPSGTSDQIVYMMVADANCPYGCIIKSREGDPTFHGQQITPSSVHIDLTKSGFTVFGAEGVEDGDNTQPFVVIRLHGMAKYQNIETPFDIQTSISPRNIDN
ncbi:MAG: prepilin-type N-terminal cleavage/methylation domain-containing protein [bacterium]|nr:prepilin-type N-terminal cleavage/methylation domain-containing protein [bacterium]